MEKKYTTASEVEKNEWQLYRIYSIKIHSKQMVSPKK